MLQKRNTEPTQIKTEFASYDTRPSETRAVPLQLYQPGRARVWARRSFFPDACTAQFYNHHSTQLSLALVKGDNESILSQISFDQTRFTRTGEARRL